jgi:hypothetical protein
MFGLLEYQVNALAEEQRQAAHAEAEAELYHAGAHRVATLAGPEARSPAGLPDPPGCAEREEPA